MRKIVSTHLFVQQRLHAGLLDLLVEAGAEGVELFCAKQSFDYTDPVQVRMAAEWFASSPAQLHSLHSPIYYDELWGRSGEPQVNIAARQPRERLRAMEEVQRALEIADKLPFRYLVQHIGASNEEWDQAKADAALTSLERLRVLAKQSGVQILVENIPNGLSQPQRLIQFLEQSHMDDIGICFDSGHAQMTEGWMGGGGALPSWEHLGGRVLSTHLHDNHGQADEHLWPGQGAVAWDQLMPLVQASGAPCLLEVRQPAGSTNPVEEIRRAFAYLESCAQGTEKMRNANS